MSFTRTLRAVGGAAVAGALLFGTAPVASADQVRNDQWALGSLKMSEAWKVSTGKGIIVAVIDNGINGSHSDLKGSVLPGKNFSTGDPADQESKNEHGTSMASIIAAHGHGAGGSEGLKGIAPDAKILAIKNWDSDGESLTNSLAKPLRYAVDHGAKVVNMSFGGYSVLSSDEKQAISYAAKKDVLLIAATGNSGSGNLNYPSAEPGVLAVGAVRKDGKAWEDSNYGPHTLLGAPGAQIRSAGVVEPYQWTKGTSDATAYVSGAAALLRAKFPDLTAGQIANRLTKTAKMPSGAGTGKTPDAHYGYGAIDPYKALTANIPPGAKNGPLKSPNADEGGSDIMKPSDNSDATEPQKSSSNSMLPIVGGILGVLVVVGVIVLIVVLRKKRQNGPPSGGPGGPGGPGVPGGYFPSQQQGSPYQQYPTAPGQQPPPPPNQAPRQ
ncbi:S8 family serine peptidase [Streptomyces sp. NPDC048483]|uniref:S8 family serine peptidase n=1 Tax=Streptomyces sp. NPDC048483 TaxID=3154927 RepID=UPI00342B5363